MEVLSSRVLLRPKDLERSLTFYGETLGLAIYREFGTDGARGVVFFLGGGFLEVSGRSPAPAGPNIELWLQVRNAATAWKGAVEAGASAVSEPARMPWGLIEGWIADPDGVRIA